jgi:hypothetical protein
VRDFLSISCHSIIACFAVRLSKTFSLSRKGAMRKTTLKLTPVRINGERFFQVISPKPGGGRIRRTFKDQADAEEHYKLAEKQIASYGAAAMLISDTLRIAAIEADKLVQPFGKTIVDAAQFYLAHLKAISASATVSHAISKLPTADCSVRYKRDIKYRLGKFEKEFGARMMAEVTTDELAPGGMGGNNPASARIY